MNENLKNTMVGIVRQLIGVFDGKNEFIAPAAREIAINRLLLELQNAVIADYIKQNVIVCSHRFILSDTMMAQTRIPDIAEMYRREAILKIGEALDKEGAVKDSSRWDKDRCGLEKSITVFALRNL